jgi:hypothetical protein
MNKNTYGLKEHGFATLFIQIQNYSYIILNGIFPKKGLKNAMKALAYLLHRNLI